MKTILTLSLAALSAFHSFAAPTKKPKKIHVPEALSSLRPISEAAKSANHVIIVNTADAVAAADWPLVANFAASRIQINIWTNSITKTLFPRMLADKAEYVSRFGDKAKVAVFIENSDSPDPYQTAQGAWCRVNLRHILKGAADRQTKLDRTAKAILKGIAYAAGCGAGYDNMSVTGYKTLSGEGLDAAGICITPEAYFPMLESLRMIGGDAILSPAVKR